MQEIHSGHKQRLREKAMKNFNLLAEHEIVELVLNFGIVRQNTNTIAHELIKKFGSANKVFNASYEELIKVKGLGEVSACLLTLIPKLSVVSSLNETQIKQPLKNLEHALFLFQMYLKNSDIEKFYMMCLDRSQKIICVEKLCEGSDIQINVNISDVVKKALKYNPKTIIFAHNHPTNVATPSSYDISFTQDLVKAFNILEIKVFEHIIVCPNGSYSYIINNKIFKAKD